MAKLQFNHQIKALQTDWGENSGLLLTISLILELIII